MKFVSQDFKLSTWALLVNIYPAISIAATPSGCKTRAIGDPPITASGYDVQVVLTGLKSPRGIAFDPHGNLLVVQQYVGINSYPISENGECVIAGDGKTVVSDDTLNHGIDFSLDGRTLYASSAEAVYSWPYNAASMATSGQSTTIVTNMSTSDHVTRTLLMSKKVPGLLLVTRGSTSNLDSLARQKSSGHSQVKSFNLTSRSGAYDFDTDGTLLGWGLRNDVGIDEHPVTGGIYTVENSVDQMTRNGVDIHENNPGEELNFLGYLNGTATSGQGGNFGYPECFTAWEVSEIPANSGITVGSQFAIGNVTATDDDNCRTKHVGPRLAFEAHMAPLDILFNAAGSEAWITFHGSWDREPAAGYKLVHVLWNNVTGEPVESVTSHNAAINIITNQNVGTCNVQSQNCFRPVGLAWDSTGRLFMSSDTTGEIFAITRTNGMAVEGTALPTTTKTVETGSTGTASIVSAPNTTSTGAASSMNVGMTLLGSLLLGLL